MVSTKTKRPAVHIVAVVWRSSPRWMFKIILFKYIIIDAKGTVTLFYNNIVFNLK